ncbi:MAG: hypothetical protein ACTSYZ_10920 [Candidatus Helarchaeota archaeon]
MSYENKVLEIIKQLDEDKELRKNIDANYSIIKGKEHYLLYALVKSFGESIEEIKQATLAQVEQLTKNVEDIVSEIKDKLNRVEDSWLEIATALGKLSEYGAIIGDFSGKLDILAKNIANEPIKSGRGSSKK